MWGGNKFQACESSPPPKRRRTTPGTHAGQRPLAVVRALNGDKLQDGLAFFALDDLVVGVALPSRHDGVGSVVGAVATQQAAAVHAGATPGVAAGEQGPG